MFNKKTCQKYYEVLQEHNSIVAYLQFWSWCDKMSPEKYTKTMYDLFREKTN